MSNLYTLVDGPVSANDPAKRPDGHMYGPFHIQQTGSGWRRSVTYVATDGSRYTIGYRETRGASGTREVINRCVALAEQALRDGTVDRIEQEVKDLAAVAARVEAVRAEQAIPTEAEYEAAGYTKAARLPLSLRATNALAAFMQAIGTTEPDTALLDAAGRFALSHHRAIISAGDLDDAYDVLYGNNEGGLTLPPASVAVDAEAYTKHGGMPLSPDATRTLVGITLGQGLDEPEVALLDAAHRIACNRNGSCIARGDVAEAHALLTAPVQAQEEMQHTEAATVEQDAPAALVIAEYEIPEQNITALEKKIKAVNRHAARLGAPPVVIERVGEVVREQRYTAYDVDGHPYERKGKFLLVQVRVTGTEPRLNGWTLAAVLEPHEHGTIVRNVPGVEMPARYRDADATYCEHCGKRRRRAETFVLAHADGRTVQVGRQCLKDFLGGLDPHAIASMAEFIRAMAGWDFGGRGERVYDTEEFLAWVLAAMRAREKPFLSRSAVEAQGGGVSTADEAKHYLMIHYGQALYDPKYDAPVFEPTEAERVAGAALRDEAVALLAAKYDTAAFSDFEHNLYTLLQSDAVRTKHLGTVAYAYGYVHKARLDAERAATAAGKPERLNEWVAAPGERGTWVLTLTGGSTFDGQFGTTSHLRFEDAEGRAFTWWASGWYEVDGANSTLTSGTAYRVTGTVKKHDAYKGRRQTVLTRCNIADYDPNAPPPAPKKRGRKAAATEAAPAAPLTAEQADYVAMCEEGAAASTSAPAPAPEVAISQADAERQGICKYCGTPLKRDHGPRTHFDGVEGRKYTAWCHNCGAAFLTFEHGGSILWRGWDAPGMHEIEPDTHKGPTAFMAPVDIFTPAPALTVAEVVEAAPVPFEDAEQAVRYAVPFPVRDAWVHDAAITAFDSGHKVIADGHAFDAGAIRELVRLTETQYNAATLRGDIRAAERNLVLGMVPMLKVLADAAGLDFGPVLDACGPAIRARFAALVGIDICTGKR